MKEKSKEKQSSSKMTVSLQKAIFDIAKKSEEEDELYSLEEAKLYLEKYSNRKIFPSKLKN